MFDILEILKSLRPIDMSLCMLVFSLVDLWTALSLSIKAKTFVSKTLIKGFIFNLLIILLPFILSAVATLSYFSSAGGNLAYIRVLSMLITALYSASAFASIAANYSAAYPEGKNIITKLAYKYLPKEVTEKQDKHGINND